jgi:hypothetical protein
LFTVADGILNDIVSPADAWQLVDGGDTDDWQDNATEIRPTVSARRVKTLVEQITSTHADHGQLEHLKVHFSPKFYGSISTSSASRLSIAIPPGLASLPHYVCVRKSLICVQCLALSQDYWGTASTERDRQAASKDWTFQGIRECLA